MKDRNEINPEVVAGKPVIKGTRIPVEKIIHLLAQGLTTEDVLEEYPGLDADDVHAALEYAAETLEEETVFRTGEKDFEVHRIA